MSWIEAVVLGVVQGLTEFLPISSTAHLAIVPRLLGWRDPGAAFTAVTQWGTWVATVVYFRRDLARLLGAFLRDLVRLRPLASQEARLAWMIAVGTVPIVVCGMTLKKYVEGPFRSTYVIAGALVGLALLLVAAEALALRRKRRGEAAAGLAEMGWGEALLVGLAQSLALVPGASRSGVTITGGLFAGLGREAATRYSFLLSLPAIFGAGLYQLVKERDVLFATGEGALGLVIATAVAGVVGYLSIAFMLSYLRRHTTAVFIAYRIALGVLLAALVWQGVVPALPPQPGE